VDVRDLAGWLVRAAETGLAGTFDGIGAPVPRGEFLARVAAGVATASAPAPAAEPVTATEPGTAAEPVTAPVLTWVPQEFLTAHGVRPWMGPDSLPMWLPLPEYAGFMTRDVTTALAAGLGTRDVAETARDTLAWLRGGGLDELVSDPPAGLSPEREAAVLSAWHASAR
jgi:hypothetical protein